MPTPGVNTYMYLCAELSGMPAKRSAWWFRNGLGMRSNVTNCHRVLTRNSIILKVVLRSEIDRPAAGAAEEPELDVVPPCPANRTPHQRAMLGRKADKVLNLY